MKREEIEQLLVDYANGEISPVAGSNWKNYLSRMLP